MVLATITSNKTILLCVASLIFQCAAIGQSAETVTLRLTDGSKLVATGADPRTNDELLWLRFGSGQVLVIRAIGWNRIAEVTIGEKAADTTMLRQWAAQQIKDGEANAPTATAPEAEPTYASQARKLLAFRPRIAAVDFDAQIANWDQDVEFDGLVLRLYPLDANGQLTCVRGTLNVELVAARREKFNDVPAARGYVVSPLAQWSVNIDAEEVTENGVVVKLPFQTNHPEFDTSWATHGLVHVRFVVPGHGVFEHSFDGVRVRPYAPLRDAMQRQNGQRFLPTEQTGVSKRNQ